MRLKELRKSCSLSQRELGDALGLSKSSIGNYENGYRQPDMATLNLLADYFGVTVDYLIGRSLQPSFVVTSEEEKMLQIYRNLPEEKRYLLIDLFLALQDSSSR
ncbi:MAG TPA: helix-turn-helix transcriptional regulator [Firmicutes bacterium]|nr:helix-turn-helix transcriptional regulator [Bacillota bacterium]